MDRREVRAKTPDASARRVRKNSDIIERGVPDSAIGYLL
jgi:hypothetical protein